MEKHTCKRMPDDSDIAWSQFFGPTLTVGDDTGDTPFHFDKRVSFCPWCGEELETKWRECRKEHFEEVLA